jgi:hypothetical protein
MREDICEGDLSNLWSAHPLPQELADQIWRRPVTSPSLMGLLQAQPHWHEQAKDEALVCEAGKKQIKQYTICFVKQ